MQVAVVAEPAQGIGGRRGCPGSISHGWR
jgi:hypothetical protein